MSNNNSAMAEMPKGLYSACKSLQTKQLGAFGTRGILGHLFLGIVLHFYCVMFYRIAGYETTGHHFE